MQKYGYGVVAAWEYDIVCDDGIIDEGGTCIFADKLEAYFRGRQNCRIYMPEQIKEFIFDGERKEIPFLAMYDHFYVVSIDISMLEAELGNKLEHLDGDDELPEVWFTRERINPLCIIHTEQIPI